MPSPLKKEPNKEPRNTPDLSSTGSRATKARSLYADGVTTASGKAKAKSQMLRKLICSDAPEQALRHRGFTSIAGVDEVGRGALCGPVVAAAVILPEEIAWLSDRGLRDSKQLDREQREELDLLVRGVAIAVSIAAIDHHTIDRVNIYQASRMAMQYAVDGLSPRPDHLLLDAMTISDPCPQKKLIYGDSLSLSIAAASVVAKVYRDNLMRDFALLYPQYGLDSHKGYSTPMHLRSLKEHGPSPIHRRTFAPVAALDADAILEARLQTEALFEDPAEDYTA